MTVIPLVVLTPLPRVIAVERPADLQLLAIHDGAREKREGHGRQLMRVELDETVAGRRRENARRRPVLQLNLQVRLQNGVERLRDLLAGDSALEVPDEERPLVLRRLCVSRHPHRHLYDTASCGSARRRCASPE